MYLVNIVAISKHGSVICNSENALNELLFAGIVCESPLPPPGGELINRKETYYLHDTIGYRCHVGKRYLVLVM